MIQLTYNYAIRYVSKTEVELLENVVYESATDTPFNGVGFTTKTARTKFINANGLKIYEPVNELEYSPN